MIWEDITYGYLLIEIVNDEIIVQLRKNAQAPILISNPVFKKSYEIPWLNNMKIKYVWN